MLTKGFVLKINEFIHSCKWKLRVFKFNAVDPFAGAQYHCQWFVLKLLIAAESVKTDDGLFSVKEL
jgi:hypothetical protein